MECEEVWVVSGTKMEGEVGWRVGLGVSKKFLRSL